MPTRQPAASPTRGAGRGLDSTNEADYPMTSTDDEQPILVFSGDYTEALFLKSLLESAAIEASLEMSLKPLPDQMPRLYVHKRDALHALELVEDFLRNGKRADP